MAKEISIKIDEETERQLNWLLWYLGRSNSISDIIAVAINNEFVNYNMECLENGEDQLADLEWMESCGKAYCEKILHREPKNN